MNLKATILKGSLRIFHSSYLIDFLGTLITEILHGAISA